MKSVSRFEATLLRVLHGILGRAPLERTASLLQKPLPRPACLHRDAVALVESTLARGCVWLLAREGWRRERWLRAGVVCEGRLWERTPPAVLALGFSARSLELLVWLVAREPEDARACLPSDASTVGDQFLFFLVYRFLRTVEIGASLRQLGLAAANPLCRLAFPEDFAERAREQKSKPVRASVARKAAVFDWGLWTSGLRSCILEALQSSLARRWLELERAKKQIKSPQHMVEVARSQEQIIGGFCQAAHAGRRWDLCRFLLGAFGQLLDGQPAPAQWIGGLDVRTMRLSERSDAFGAALVLLRILQRLSGWTQEARAIGYFDEGYAASQLWKADWEQYGGDELCRRAENVLRQVAPL